MNTENATNDSLSKEEAERRAREVARRMLTTPKKAVEKKRKPASTEKIDRRRPAVR
jgi:hypothetical protein